MASFRLTRNTMRRLQAQYIKFKRARQTVHANIQSYIDDYTKFTGSRDDRRGTLEEKYLPRSPQMGWLVFDDGRGILWQEDDIAALIGRSQASISRTLQRMEQTPGWCARLLAVSEQTKAANNNAITAYHEEVFDLILDKYEEEYLQKVINPRRGTPKDADEVMRFWEYLKASDEVCEFDSSLAIMSETPQEMPDLPRVRWSDAAVLLFRKIITPKTGAVFPILFALSCELVRRWPIAAAFVFGASIVTLGVCVGLLHLRRGRAGLVSDIGAVALMMSVFWGVALLSEGRVYMPGGTALLLNNEHKITLEPELAGGHRIMFRVLSDAYDDLKEILCSIDGSGYKFTGFNDMHYPNLIIEPETQDGTMNINLKYIDGSKEHGPFAFTYDLDKLRFDLSKKFIINSKWLYISRIAGNASVNVYIDNRYADDVAGAVVYGINKDVPDTEQSIRPGSSTIASMRDNRLQYVTSYLIFKDGTKSNTRRAE